MKKFDNIIPRNSIKFNFANQGKADVKFEHDSCPEAWTHYERIYNTTIAHGTEWEKGITYDINNRYSISNRPKFMSKNKDGYFRNFQCLNIKGDDFKFGGDCDFNFNRKLLKSGKTRVEEVKERLCNENYLEKLNICVDNHHRLVNLSLILTTGGLNLFRGRLGSGWTSDRFDEFIYQLNKFYMLKETSPENLKDLPICKKSKNILDFLSKFNSIYDYMEKMYFIEDKLFVNRLISNGAKSLHDEEVLQEYIDLALKYWDLREKKFIEIYKINY